MMDFLTEVYADYLAKHNLPEVPAEELPFVVNDMMRHQAWLDRFTEIWDLYA
jgi:hypothetical protein